VVDTGDDKVVDRDGDITMDAVVTTDSEAVSTPMIEDITKDDNFVDVSVVHKCGEICFFSSAYHTRLILCW